MRRTNRDVLGLPAGIPWKTDKRNCCKISKETYNYNYN